MGKKQETLASSHRHGPRLRLKEWQKSERERRRKQLHKMMNACAEFVYLSRSLITPPPLQRDILTYADAFYRLDDLYIFVPARYSDQLFFLFIILTIWSRLLLFSHEMIKALQFYGEVIYRAHIYFFPSTTRFSCIFFPELLTVPPSGSLSSLLETSVPWSRCALRSLFTPAWSW